jgi:glycosyltransferase involved in cell wall biosynthesis
MNKPAALSVDVVIPVFNAPELTKRCIDSVMTHLKQSIGTVYVQDDASSDETRAMLDATHKFISIMRLKIKVLVNRSMMPLPVPMRIWCLC